MRRNWKKEMFTIPNLLSLFRLLLIPAYVRIYLRASRESDYLLAGGILAVSCLTDLLDGYIARRCNMVSDVGKLLDPAADKLTQLVLILCLAGKHPILYPVLALFLAKELFQIFAVIVHYHRGKALSGALTAGKVCTTVLFFSMILLVLFPRLPNRWVSLLALLDSVFLLFSFSRYVLAYYGKGKQIRDIPRE